MILAKHFFTLMSAPSGASGALQKRILASTLVLGMILPQVAFCAIPKDDDTPPVQNKRSIPFQSPHLYFADQSKKLLYIGTHSCLGPTNPQITGIQATIKTFKPTVAVVDECAWPIATVKHAGNTAMRRYPALLNDHHFINQILTRLREGERVLVITTATRLREVKPLLEKGLTAPSPTQALEKITHTRRQFDCVHVLGCRFIIDEAV